MKPNLGTFDRTMRLIAAALVIVLYFMNYISGTVAVVLLVIAAILILTSFISFCPLYFPFGFSTRKKEK